LGLKHLEPEKNIMAKVEKQEPVVVAGQLGLDHLSDDQVLPLLLAMDPDTLLNCGKASERLFNLVCDREVWRELLKKTEEFIEEKVEELKEFKGSKGSPEMMPELVKESARRIPYSHKPIPHLRISCGGADADAMNARRYQEWLNGIKNRVKVTLTVEGGWSNHDYFDVDCNGLEELASLAKAVGVKLILVEAEELPAPVKTTEAWKVVVAHMEQQEVKLEKLKVISVAATHRHVEQPQEWLIFPLLKLSKRWEIESLVLPRDLDDQFWWTSLADIPTSGGHIGMICSSPGQHPLDTTHLNTLKKLWEISEEIQTFPLNPQGTGWRVHDFHGGRASNLDLEAEWQRVLESIQ